MLGYEKMMMVPYKETTNTGRVEDINIEIPKTIRKMRSQKVIKKKNRTHKRRKNKKCMNKNDKILELLIDLI